MLENSLVPMKTVSLVSGEILSHVRTPKESLRDPTGQAAKNPANKTEIDPPAGGLLDLNQCSGGRIRTCDLGITRNPRLL
ncbi:MAG: hypothetical protein HYT40_01240 [Candidatus Sungbacteria bacterium]|uniref:Uncharacterized protein n=1 Tax=Candidatus Sungiibacteriota bacterium TaxID=2750080 RepID=A0A931SB72_9BACT|nr:hypothetical protein [Candidatus Sungbacteria bacterium]